ncbi:MAG: hypothetical protein ACK55Z_37210, partial [bacterium]
TSSTECTRNMCAREELSRRRPATGAPTQPRPAPHHISCQLQEGLDVRRRTRGGEEENVQAKRDSREGPSDGRVWLNKATMLIHSNLRDPMSVCCLWLVSQDANSFDPVLGLF